MCYCATVIFLVDVRVSFDEFKQSMIGICDQKTIITTNPGYQAWLVLLCWGMCVQLSTVLYNCEELMFAFLHGKTI